MNCCGSELGTGTKWTAAAADVPTRTTFNWVRADADLVQQLGQARAGTDLGTPVLEQLACVELLGEIGRILPGRLADLRRRRALSLT